MQHVTGVGCPMHVAASSPKAVTIGKLCALLATTSGHPFILGTEPLVRILTGPFGETVGQIRLRQRLGLRDRSRLERVPSLKIGQRRQGKRASRRSTECILLAQPRVAHVSDKLRARRVERRQRFAGHRINGFDLPTIDAERVDASHFWTTAPGDRGARRCVRSQRAKAHGSEQETENRERSSHQRKYQHFCHGVTSAIGAG